MSELIEQVQSDKFRASLAAVAPKHMTPDRIVRVTFAAMRRTPDLMKCTPQSVCQCLMDLTASGLEPDGRLAHLIPFRNNKANVYECQLVVDYKGLAELAYRSGEVHRIHADVVHRHDLFEYDRGEIQRHVPWYLRQDQVPPPEDGGDVFAVYCEVELKSGARKAEVMSVAEVKKIQAQSRAGRSGPWVTHWEEMAKKTAFRRVAKWIPLSPEKQTALHRDDEFQFQRQAVEASTAETVRNAMAELMGKGTPAIASDEDAKTETLQGED